MSPWLFPSGKLSVTGAWIIFPPFLLFFIAANWAIGLLWLICESGRAGMDKSLFEMCILGRGGKRSKLFCSGSRGSWWPRGEFVGYKAMWEEDPGVQ